MHFHLACAVIAALVFSLSSGAKETPCYIPEIENGKIGRYVSVYFSTAKVFRAIPVGERIEDNEKLFLQCDTGRNSVGSRTNRKQSVSCSGGKWSEVLSCPTRPCGKPFLENGVIVYNSPDSVSFECEVGYRLIGFKHLFCLGNGSWNERLPRCKGISCNRPKELENGHFSYMSPIYLQILQLECNKGYRLNDNTPVYCTADGVWSRTDIQCIEVECDVPQKPKHGNVKLIGSTSRVGSMAVFSCDGNRILDGPTTSICLDTGQWTFPTPRCLDAAVRCKVLDAKDTFYISYSDDRKVGSVARYSCKISSQSLSGSDTLICQETGEWSHLEPVCEAICSDPAPIANGRADAIGKLDNVFYAGSSINYSCQALHYLKGEKTLSCTSNGTWSAKKPECVKVSTCERVPVPIGGFVTYLAPIKSGTQQRSGVYQPRILSRASTKAPMPQNIQMSTTPEPVTVPLPEGMHGLGARAVYDCESKYYNLIGSRTRTCRKNGQWSGRHPICMPVCGRSDSPRSTFIVNGNVTDIGQWPWQAGIAQYDSSFLLCGASLINEQWLITAAHCLTYEKTTWSIEPDQFQVYVGKHYRGDDEDDEYVQVRKIKEIVIHPDYDPVLLDADIALMLLDTPVQLNSRVKPVCLPTEQTTRENLVEGQKGVVTGWGLNENDIYSETLQQAVLPVVSSERCEKDYEESEYPLTVTYNTFCAGNAEGKSGACSGDSGGPMVFTDPFSKQKKWVLEGIVSWGSPRGCGTAKHYGGFTTVSRFLPWIHNYF